MMQVTRHTTSATGIKNESSYINRWREFRQSYDAMAEYLGALPRIKYLEMFDQYEKEIKKRNRWTELDWQLFTREVDSKWMQLMMYA